MIKIIEPGTRKVTSCEYCGCKFSYEKEDIEVSGLHSINQLPTRKYYIECPQCGEEIVLEAMR